jgi:hypothetical protein
VTQIKDDGGLDRMQAILQNWANLSARDVAPEVDSFMRGQLAKHQTPEGDPWQENQKGEPALPGADAAYTQRVSGNAIVMEIGGGEKSKFAFAHFGAKGDPVRRQLPKGTMPARLGDAIRAGLVKWFKATSKAGKRGYAYYRARGKNPLKVGK